MTRNFVITKSVISFLSISTLQIPAHCTGIPSVMQIIIQNSTSHHARKSPCSENTNFLHSALCANQNDLCSVGMGNSVNNINGYMHYLQALVKQTNIGRLQGRTPESWEMPGLWLPVPPYFSPLCIQYVH